MNVLLYSGALILLELSLQYDSLFGALAIIGSTFGYYETRFDDAGLASLVARFTVETGSSEPRLEA